MSSHTLAKRSARKHVFEDLKPYVCTFIDCGMTEYFFENREEWFRHETQYHRFNWFCNMDGHPEFESESDFIVHMATYHDMRLDESKLQTLKPIFQKPLKISSGICHLCGKSAKRLKSHLAHHLQQLSLFALPRLNMTEGSGDAELDTLSSRFVRSKQTESQTSSQQSSSSSSKSPSENLALESLEKTTFQPEEPVVEEDIVEQVNVPDLPHELGWDEMTTKFVDGRKGLRREDVPEGFLQDASQENIIVNPPTLGICGMDAEVRSAPCRTIWRKMQYERGRVKVVIFGDECILEERKWIVPRDSRVGVDI